MTIEPLTVADLEHAAQFGAAFYAETGMPRTFEPARFVAIWTELYRVGMGVILGIEVDGELVGALAAMVAPGIYDGQTEAQECFIYIRPEFRDRGCFQPLLAAYEAWADAQGAVEKRIACMEGNRPEALERVYRRLGYVPLERHYIKKVT